MIKEYIDWNDFRNMIIQLNDMIKDSGRNIKFITGIPRGGLIPAVMLSHILKIQYFDVNKIDKQTDDFDNSEILIIDDI